MTPDQMTPILRDLSKKAPVIPVITVTDIAQAVPMAEALIDGGLPVLEVTLRTDCALEAIKAMSQIKGGYVGAGTVLNPTHLKAAKDAGATFIVSPGATDALLDAAEEHDMPILPGAVTASESMRLLERGYALQKFFPAEAAGGVKYLASLSAPIPQVKFCPTGGVTPQNAGDYLKLPNVMCVGGTWILPKDAVANGDWDQIKDLARAAASLSFS